VLWSSWFGGLRPPSWCLLQVRLVISDYYCLLFSCIIYSATPVLSHESSLFLCLCLICPFAYRLSREFFSFMLAVLHACRFYLHYTIIILVVVVHVDSICIVPLYLCAQCLFYAVRFLLLCVWPCLCCQCQSAMCPMWVSILCYVG